MPAMVPRTDWTLDDLDALPQDGSRYEIVDGVLEVSPSPRLLHQWACMRLQDVIGPWVAQQGLGYFICLPVNVDFGPRTHLEPDASVVPAAAGGQLPATLAETKGPLLVIEVLSPSTARIDRVVKRAVYQREGIEYWVVDLDARTFERWLPTDARPEVATETLTWAPAGASGDLTIDVAAYFRAVYQETP